MWASTWRSFRRCTRTTKSRCISIWISRRWTVTRIWAASSSRTIGQNKETADVRLREGEVNLIGGIIQRTDTKSKTGIPGLANIPGIGRLFSGENITDNKTELVIALIPHIVRGPDINASDLRGVDAGNAIQIKVSRAPLPAATAEKPPATDQAAVPAPGVVPPATTPPPTAPRPPVTAPPVAGPPATAPPLGPGAPQGAAAARISFLPPLVDAQFNSSVTVTIYGDNINDMASVAAQLRYDPKILRINNIAAGDLPQRNVPQAARLEPSKNILNDTGQADVSLSRGLTGGGISGGGGLFTVVFQAVGRGSTNVSLSSVGLKTPAGRTINATLPPALVVNVK